jgi:hypothetical protein
VRALISQYSTRSDVIETELRDVAPTEEASLETPRTGEGEPPAPE